ncbi:DUF87 domain-containing protein [Aphanizomenon flos-aquae NRERC-008]|uniref:helicase HerA domain-containing protein n=1 Tax=Aphanizomenon TaxID=1175 RepID=UPI0018F030A5|nr:MULTISPECIES: DUF87 domain-containing protein [Aphanizomenon]MDS9397351.1 DUF87 domain-containing protein [Aphanizomenon flos-aquae NRERC-008]
MDLLDLLNNQSDEFNIGSVGSPSNTTEILIDINQKSEKKRNLGQLVYLIQPQEQEKLVVIGQISEIETKNRWHEDLTFRGIIKRRGSLPHLSEKADVRTAKLNVQACFSIAPDGKISEGILGTSPATGTPIFSVRDEILDNLLAQYKNQIIYLGHAYATDVKMPLWLKHFDRDPKDAKDDEKTGAGEAYHIGVFGKSGSGKSGLAAYMLLGYARHKNMGMIFIDPQNQFASDKDLPLKLHDSLKKLGRKVEVYSLTNQIRLGTESNAVSLFSSILLKADFYANIGVKFKENQKDAAERVKIIIANILSQSKTELKKAPDDLLIQLIQSLRNDSVALERIYSSKESRKRLENTLDAEMLNVVTKLYIFKYSSIIKGKNVNIS